jgi:hypothetical protein
MKQRLIALTVFVLVAALAAGLAWQRRESPQARRERLVEQFIAVLPDSLGNDHILEIRHLFYILYQRADQGQVRPETLRELDDKLAGYVEKGRIAPNELVHFMAEVGYGTYKDEPRYNLEDKSVDHPVLNPQSAMVGVRFDSTQYDSAFWAEFEEWKKDHAGEFSDTTFQQDSLPPRR